jgi:hypothetical protein
MNILSDPKFKDGHISNVNPVLSAGSYVIKHRILGLFFACSPLNERESHFTQNIDEARRWSAEYLNRTAWDWSLESEAVCLP